MVALAHFAADVDAVEPWHEPVEDTEPRRFGTLRSSRIVLTVNLMLTRQAISVAGTAQRTRSQVGIRLA